MRHARNNTARVLAGWRRAAALAAGAALAGCALAPPPSTEQLGETVAEHAPLPPAFVTPGASPGHVEDGWLATFADARLDELVAEALAYNSDLRVAAARVEQAGAMVRVAGGKLYPTVDALARGGGEMSGDNSGLEGIGVTASWELDLWGRVRYGTRVAKEQYASAQADLEFARQSLAALVAKSWFLATETVLQQAMLAEMVDAAENLQMLAEQRLRVGIGSELDVATARVNVQNFRDSLRQVDLAHGQSLRALELLLGRYPAADVGVPRELGSLAALEGGVPAGLPSELLERRPDLIAAQNRVAAAFSRVREAQAARLPRFSLTGGVSSISSDLFVLEERDNPVWSIGASLLAPLYAGGALKAQVEVRSAEQQQAAAQYVSTALAAFRDVENALSSEAVLKDRETILTAAVADARRALELAETRYRVGSADLRAVQERQIDFHTARMNLLRVEAERRVQRVNLHLALGGDFAAG
ncbi:MAG TPA: efflux transporter outer membrane subunit [Gammaproteobacteria bacterium]|nr:efflux transporter outer membrane subunit [Gammaproteobacteria bacterium]